MATTSEVFSDTPAPERGGSARFLLGRVFHAESSNYFLLLGVTLFMVVFGLIMVLSSSFVDAHDAGGTFFTRFLSQALYAMIGVPLMLVVSRLPQRFWEKWSLAFLLFTCVLQALVVFTPLGYEINGNRNWLNIGVTTFQPSELMKIALIVWLGTFFVRKTDKVRQWRHSLIPVLLVSGFAIGLIMLGHDLGTAVIMAGVVLGALFFAGTPLRHLLVLAGVGVGFALVFAVTSPNRMNRVLAFLHPQHAEYLEHGWQMQQGMFALAAGGVFGVGLGNSQSKWAWLPASSTDFIFAITGEELGLIGAVLVLALFAFLAFVFCRMIVASADPFERVVTGAVLVWVIGQALVNIGVVLGLLPTLGVPLPLISAGGTALISTLFAIGIVLSFARRPSRRFVREPIAHRPAGRVR